MISAALTLLDGMKDIPNVVLIGTTNRKDCIDEALLRAGRIEQHIEIGLPNEEDRLEILGIHTKGILLENVNLTRLAAITKNYSGAEIKGLADLAAKYAMSSNLEEVNGELVLKKEIQDGKLPLAKVQEQHFDTAFADIQPTFGADRKYFTYQSERFLAFSDEIIAALESFNQAIKPLLSKKIRQLNYFISGCPGTGKTELAMHLAMQSGASNIQILNAKKLLESQVSQQPFMIQDVFNKAYQSEFSVVILDGLEELLGADASLQGYNNQLRLNLLAYLQQNSSKNNHCIVIATAKDRKFSERLGLLEYFDAAAKLHKIKLEFNEKTRDLLSNLCLKLDYSFVDSDVSANEKLEISIRELVVKINCFCSDERNNGELDFNKFMQSIISQPARHRLFTHKKDKSDLTLVNDRMRHKPH